MKKKAYTAPTIIEHGNAVEQTQGFGGYAWELGNPMVSDYGDPPPPPRD